MNPNILERVLKQIALTNSTMETCALMQVIKQPEHGRTSTTAEQKLSSFQTKYERRIIFICNLFYFELSKDIVMDLML